MKDIKFRLWNKVLKSFLPNFSLNHHEEKKYDGLYGYITTVDDCVLQQYTGYKDKNGKEIFEGDLVKIILEDFHHPLPNASYDDVYIPKIENICEVRFRKSAGWICLVRQGKYKGKVLKLKDNHDEIIGNIFENIIDNHKHPITNIFK